MHLGNRADATRSAFEHSPGDPGGSRPCNAGSDGTDRSSGSLVRCEDNGPRRRAVRRGLGSADEFRRFVESTSPGFLRVAYALLGDRASAEDATQIALLRTYRHWGRALESPGGYTWRVLVNVCRDEGRRRGRSREGRSPEGGDRGAGGWDSTEHPSLETLGANVAERLDLRDALQRLPYAQREVVVLRYYLGLSVPETAGVLNVPDGTVKSMTARALVHLRAHLSTRDLEVHDVE